MKVHAAWRAEPQRLGFTFLDAAASGRSRSWAQRHAPHGSDDLPWDELADVDAVYFTAGDAGALRQARRARVLVATPRAREAFAWATSRSTRSCAAARTPASGSIPETSILRRASTWSPTAPAAGTGPRPRAESGHWAAAALPGPVADAYGCGDSFAAGVTYGLGPASRSTSALELAARCGAACLTGAGPYSVQLSLAPPT